MKIQQIKNFPIHQNHNISNTRQQNSNNFVNNLEYNPLYYKPSGISFKGKLFESYFPTDILGLKEKEFDKIILNIIQDKDTKKRDALANYIVNTVARKTNAMDFINMWKRQVPTLVSPGMISIGGSNSSSAISKVINLTARNSSNAMIDKFYASDFQTDILAKDGKNAMGGLLTYKLFMMASADPELYSKAALYAAGFAVSIGTYALNKQDSKKIQDQQFLNATKECIRLGVLDPYLLLEKINKSLISGVDKKDYTNWLNARFDNLRLIKTGSKINKTGCFDHENAQEVLDKVLFVMSSELKIDDEKIVNFLNLMEAVYKSSHEISDAYYIIKKIEKIQQNMFDNDRKRSFHYQPLFYTYGELADIKKTQEEYGYAITYLDFAKRVAKNTYGENSQQVMDTNLKILDYMQESKKHYETILPFVEAEQEVSLSTERKNYYTKLKEDILFRFNKDKYGDFLDTDDLQDNKTAKTLNEVLEIIQKNPEFAEKFDELLNILNKYPDKIMHYTLISAIRKDKKGVFKEIIKTQLSKLNQKNSSDNPKAIRKLFVLNELYKNCFSNYYFNPYKRNDLEISIINKYGETSDERAEFCKIFSEWTKMFDTEKDFGLYEITPKYTEKLFTRYRIFRKEYGTQNEKTIKAAIDYISSAVDKDIAGTIISDFEENVPIETKQKYSSKIYEAYANRINASLKRPHTILENTVIEGMLAYQKAIKSTKTPNPLLIYNYLNFIDMVKSKEIEPNTIPNGFACFCYVPAGEGPLIQRMDMLKRSEKEKLYDETQIYRNLENYESELKDLVKSCPGPFRINERKLLQLFEKHFEAIFQRSYKTKIINQLAQIESSIKQHKIQ